VSASRRPAVRVVVADDHPVVRVGVRNILATASEFQIVGESSDGEAALRMVDELSPDLLLLDLAMPKMSGIDVLRAVRQIAPELKTIVLAGTVDRRQTLDILQLGAKGILLKDVVADRLTTAALDTAGLALSDAGPRWSSGRSSRRLRRSKR